MSDSPEHIDEARRRLLGTVAVGLAASAWPGSTLAESTVPIDAAAVRAAESLAGLELTGEERALMLNGLEEQRKSYQALRGVAIDNGVAPAFRFDPVPAGQTVDQTTRTFDLPLPGTDEARPHDLESLAFWPVWRLARLIRSRRVRSIELTEMFLDRIERLDPKLHAVITPTPERARRQAEAADREIAAGRYRGPLHGIPWGAKDLLAVAGYPTTWGARPYQDQVLEQDATVVRRLDDAGAVLIAKLSLGALAWGDVWFGGMTRNPWKLEQGSSGSSAGSAAATVAGMVGFAIGSETWGSIVSPASRCGATGLRPTFGRVSRHGAMALSWTMDKLGPLCRSAIDCAIVFDAIHGADGRDPTAQSLPFGWDPTADVRQLRVGVVEGLFAAGDDEAQDLEPARASLAVLRRLGVQLVPLELPDLPIEAMSFLLSAEAAAAFDELTRSGRDDQLVRQIENAWPNVFRQARLIPAVEYIQANRMRTLVMAQLADRMRGLDGFVAPSFAGSHLLMTNLTGHPAVVLPNGARADGTPTSITFTGQLYGEEKLLQLAVAYQAATDAHQRQPPI